MRKGISGRAGYSRKGGLCSGKGEEDCVQGRERRIVFREGLFTSSRLFLSSSVVFSTCNCSTLLFNLNRCYISLIRPAMFSKIDISYIKGFVMILCSPFDFIIFV